MRKTWWLPTPGAVLCFLPLKGATDWAPPGFARPGGVKPAHHAPPAMELVS